MTVFCPPPVPHQTPVGPVSSLNLFSSTVQCHPALPPRYQLVCKACLWWHFFSRSRFCDWMIKVQQFISCSIFIEGFQEDHLNGIRIHCHGYITGRPYTGSNVHWHVSHWLESNHPNPSLATAHFTWARVENLQKNSHFWRTTWYVH